MAELTDGQRAALGVVAGVVLEGGSPPSTTRTPPPQVDDVIDTIVASGGTSQFAATTEQSSERRQALQRLGQPGASTKAKVSPEQAMAKLEAKLERMTDQQRLDYVNQDRSEDAQKWVDEAYMAVAVGSPTYDDDSFTVPDAYFDDEDEDVSDIIGEGDEYGDMAFLNDEEAA